MTCLLTDTPFPKEPRGSNSLQRRLNLVTMSLSLRSVFMEFRGTNPSSWLEGQDIYPGIKVISGPFDWQSAPSNTIPKKPQDTLHHASLSDVQRDLCPCPEPEENPDFTSVPYTTVAIECKQKRANIPQNVILAHILPATTHVQEIFKQAADTTSFTCTPTFQNAINKLPMIACSFALQLRARSNFDLPSLESFV